MNRLQKLREVVKSKAILIAGGTNRRRFMANLAIAAAKSGETVFVVSGSRRFLVRSEPKTTEAL